MKYSEKILKRFIKDYSLPIQIPMEGMMDYYIDLYDPVFNTKEKWNMFTSELDKFPSEEEFLTEENRIINKIVDKIKNNPIYNEFITCDIDTMIPIHADVDGVPFVKTVNLYTPSNNGKYFISMDMKKANYQALKMFSSSLVFNTNTYEEMVSKFTDSKYFKNSKHIRQVVFGQLNMNRIARQERFLNEAVLKCVIDTGYPKDKIITFTTDEIIIECTPQMFLGASGCTTLQNHIYETTGIEVRVEDFKLIYMGNNTYVKEHPNGISPTFKGGSSVYFPQAYKAYMHLPLNKRDMYFKYEDQLAEFVKPLEWLV